jgi:hypothetical protein
LLAADPGDSVGRRWRALALLYLGHARDALALDAEVIPARPANASPAALDLTLFYNSRVDEGEFDMSGNGSGFVPGLRTLAGVAFDVRGGILLGGLATLGQLNPARVAISFKGYALRLHMLQYAMFDTTDGSLVGRYVLRYRNGERRELPIRYGIDVRNWWHGQSIGDKDDRLAEATVAWEGHQRGASTYGASIRFFKRTYENPLPEIEITSIDFESTMATPCAPVLLAITVEGGTQDKQPPASR